MTPLECSVDINEYFYSRLYNTINTTTTSSGGGGGISDLIQMMNAADQQIIQKGLQDYTSKINS